MRLTAGFRSSRARGSATMGLYGQLNEVSCRVYAAESRRDGCTEQDPLFTADNGLMV